MPIDPATIARKARSKSDAAVERLARRSFKALGFDGCSGLKDECRCRERRAQVRAIITKAYEAGRQSAARECADITDWYLQTQISADIRERFDMEGK